MNFSPKLIAFKDEIHISICSSTNHLCGTMQKGINLEVSNAMQTCNILVMGLPVGSWFL
jgi:hypothetical protein